MNHQPNLEFSEDMRAFWEKDGRFREYFGGLLAEFIGALPEGTRNFETATRSPWGKVRLIAKNEFGRRVFRIERA